MSKHIDTFNAMYKYLTSSNWNITELGITNYIFRSNRRIPATRPPNVI